LKAYDAIFILPAHLDSDGVAAAMQRVRDEIGKLGGQTQEPEGMGKKAFARPMKKQDAGHYVKLRFNLDPEKVAPLRGRIKLIEDVFRVQILQGGQPVPGKRDAGERTPVAGAEKEEAADG